MLAKKRVSRVAADPPKPPAAAVPGGWGDTAYCRLHGSPHIYRSTYDVEAIEAQAKVIASLSARGADVWTIYDNTTLGAATANALQLVDVLRRTGSRRELGERGEKRCG